jgi:hypothetical protein
VVDVRDDRDVAQVIAGGKADSAGGHARRLQVMREVPRLRPLQHNRSLI